MSPIGKASVGVAIIAAVALVMLSRRPRSPEQPVSLPPAETRTEAVPPTPTADRSGEIVSLKGRLAEEMEARRRVEAEAAALRAQVAPLKSNVVISLGKVEDIGKRAGAFLPAMGDLQALSRRDPSTLAPDEKRRLLELQRDHAKFLGALPEITHFQDSPDEYGRFFRSMLQEAAGLTDPQATQVEEYMRQRAGLMNQQELNAAKEPEDPKLEEVWEERRDKFNEETANGLKAILPAGAAEKAGFGPELMEFLEMDFDKLTPKPDGPGVPQKPN